ncbi:MAG: hypothetical protein ACPG31_03295 [Planctomycetota bacterium]
METTPDHHGQDAFLELLLELVAQCQADPQLAEEWNRASETFFGKTNAAPDPHAEHRFREWFLLERASDKLGTPPAVFFAPDAPEPDTLWFRLLDSFLGIFKGIGNDDNGAPLLEDLWSGRQIRLAGTPMNIDESGVLVGRVAHGGGEQHVPLPGATFLVAPGLADALARDLSRTRATQPRARLSQLECEDLLIPYRPQAAPETGLESTWQEDLEKLLLPHADWSMERVLGMVQEQGIQDALTSIAFSSEIDLEELRLVFQEMAQQVRLQEENATAAASNGTELEQALAQVEETVDPQTVAQALAAFDAAAEDGADLVSRFAALEQQLGLEPGTSDPYEEIVQREPTAEERVGLEQPPGIPLCLATYLWEKEQAGEHPTRDTLQELSEFLEFLQELQLGTFEPERVLQHQLLAYLCRTADVAALDGRIQHLDDFLGWLILEQDAPLDWSEEARTKVREVVAFNASLEVTDAPADAMAMIDNLAPLTVAAEDGESCAVLGWPEGTEVSVQKGDALHGHWSSGSFIVRAWFPQALMPKQAATQAE